MTQASVLLLAGGGIDSTLCMHLLSEQGRAFRALHIDFGQPAAHLEWSSVQREAARHTAESDQVKIRSTTGFHGGEVRGRNAAFIFQAILHARGIERFIQIGVHAGTPFFDCSKSFITTMCSLVAECTDASVVLQAPLLELKKPEIVALCRSRKIDMQPLHSCQKGVSGGCGRCHSCLDRRALRC